MGRKCRYIEEYGASVVRKGFPNAQGTGEVPSTPFIYFVYRVRDDAKQKCSYAGW